MSEAFTLDPRLAADTAPVAALALSDLLLMEDARFPWLIMVPRRFGMSELIDLDQMDRAMLFDEIVKVSGALKAVTACDKLNVAALGNQVRQLHVHVIARFVGDPAWAGPVWGSGTAVAYETDVRDRLIRDIKNALPD